MATKAQKTKAIKAAEQAKGAALTLAERNAAIAQANQQTK